MALIEYTPLCICPYTFLLPVKMSGEKKSQQNSIHQVTIYAKSCEVIIIAETNGCKNTIWLLFLPPWWEQNWCKRIGLQTKKVNKQIPLPFGTQIWENAIRKNQVWECGTELFRRGKGQPTKKTGKTRMEKLRVSSGMVHQFSFITSLTQLNSVKLNWQGVTTELNYSSNLDKWVKSLLKIEISWR